MTSRKTLPLCEALALAATMLVLVGLNPADASATFPGGNGKIAAVDGGPDGGIYAMNPGGTGAPGYLTSDPTSTSSDPAWSSDGSQLLFMSDREDVRTEIWVMNADGSGKTQLTDGPSADTQPVWSPDGSKIAFTSQRDGNSEIYVMNADGSGLQTNLTNNPAGDGGATWSPDGSRIAFTRNGEIYAMSADGSGPQTNLTNNPAQNGAFDGVAWSPDGSKIAFTSRRDGNYEIYMMNADGSGAPARLTNTPDDEVEPAFSPDGSKLAFQSFRDDNGEIYVINANGSGPQTNLTQNAAEDQEAVWSPDSAKLAFVSSRGDSPDPFDNINEVWTMNADGSGQTRLKRKQGSSDRHPDWQPITDPPPIIFVHGFAGSTIACGDDTLYPNIPVEFSEMRLAADGETNLQQGACNPLAAPAEILESFLTEDVYGPGLDFLDQIAPDNNYIYVWDWRKSPQLALDELDLMVERARCGGTLPSGEITCADPVHPEVALMGHSMGGLVIRDYINDQPRADKVARALTIGTPYWGSPKAIFPLATGLESPAAEALDNIIVDSEFQEWAKNAQGLYFLYPSANFGDWLTVAGREPRPLDRAGLLDYVTDLGGTPALLERALDAHAQDLDGFERNGVDFQAFVGAGLATVERVLFFEAAGQDYVKLNYAQGDGTVPVRSGAQGPQGTADPLGDNIPIHYSCGIAHVPLPGDPAITPRITDFLVSGSPIVPGPTSCASSGFQIEIFEVEVGGRRAAKNSTALDTASPGIAVAETAAAGEPMTLEEAELAGLISLIDLGAQKVIVTDSATPVDLTYSSAQFELNATPLTDANLGQTSYYGPLSGEVTINTASTLSIADAGGAVTPLTEGAPAIAISDASVIEGETATVNLALSHAVAFPVAVDFATADQSAAAPGDYSSRQGTVVFDPGQQSKQITIPTSADNSQEQSESFRVVLSNALDATIAETEAVVTIADAGGGPPDEPTPPGAAPPAAANPADTRAPETKLERKPKNKITGSKATYEFSADERGANFECKLDRKQFKPCASPKKLKRLKPGRHTFEVRAIDAAGNADASPAVDRFRVVRGRR